MVSILVLLISRKHDFTYSREIKIPIYKTVYTYNFLHNNTVLILLLLFIITNLTAIHYRLNKYPRE